MQTTLSSDLNIRPYSWECLLTLSKEEDESFPQNIYPPIFIFSGSEYGIIKKKQEHKH